MPSAIENVVPVSDHSVDTFDAGSAKPTAVVQSLIRNGGCFLRGLIDQESINAMLQDVQPHLDADVPWEGEFFPKETRRTQVRRTVKEPMLRPI